MKLSKKQKEVLKAMQDGCRIYSTYVGRPGNVGGYSATRYTNGKGIGGTAPYDTLRILREHGLINISSDDNLKTIYSLTELGKSFNLKS